jgi:hypothetical protein
MYRHNANEVGLTTDGVGRLICSDEGVNIPLLDTDLTSPVMTGATQMVVVDNTGQLGWEEKFTGLTDEEVQDAAFGDIGTEHGLLYNDTDNRLEVVSAKAKLQGQIDLTSFTNTAQQILFSSTATEYDSGDISADKTTCDCIEIQSANEKDYLANWMLGFRTESTWGRISIRIEVNGSLAGLVHNYDVAANTRYVMSGSDLLTLDDNDEVTIEVSSTINTVTIPVLNVQGSLIITE